MRACLTLFCLIGAASALSSVRFSATEADNFVDITYDGATQLLSVPQHCRAETCGANTQRIASLEAVQRANTKAIAALVDALSKHQNEAATDAELAGVKAELQQAIATISLTPGQKGDKGERGASGANGSAGAKGEAGSKGATGANGAAGAPGADGATGAPGPAGAKGAKGDKGASGASSCITGSSSHVSLTRCTSGGYGSYEGKHALFLSAHTGGWPSNAFCNSAAEGPGGAVEYTLEADMYNKNGWGGVHSGHLGLGWNAKDADNYDFVYFRPHSSGGCYQTGQMVSGTVQWSGSSSASCNGGGVSGGSWFHIKLVVSGSTAKIYKNGVHLYTQHNHFPLNAKGNMIVANGYSNDAYFANFKLTKSHC